MKPLFWPVLLFPCSDTRDGALVGSDLRADRALDGGRLRDATNTSLTSARNALLGYDIIDSVRYEASHS